MKGIIPTGGRGTRMRPITFTANKHFIPVGNKPLIFYPIETLVSAGIKNILLTYNTGDLDQIKNFLGSGSKWGAKFTYILQPEPKGLANIVQVCEQKLDGESFVFHLGDNIFTEGIKNLVDYFVKHKPNGLLPVVHHPDNLRMGVPIFDKKGKLIKYVEKPKIAPHDLAVPGLYFADQNFFKAFKGQDAVHPSARGEWEIPDPFQWMIDHHYNVETMEIKSKWLDPGKFDDWLVANQTLLDINTKSDLGSRPDSQTKIEGRVRIGKNCQIINSIIRGPVDIADKVQIINSFIGPYTSIASECIVDSCNVQNSVLMHGTKLEKIDKTIDNSIIGSDSYVCGNRGGNRNMELVLSELSNVHL